MGRLDDRVILVTGAARGQGAKEAKCFAEEGADVVLTDVEEEEGERMAKKIGARPRSTSMTFRAIRTGAPYLHP